MKSELTTEAQRHGEDTMAPQRKPRRFVLGQLVIGGSLTTGLTYVSLAIADHVGTPQAVRYLLSPGFVLGLRFASGESWLDRLGSFGLIAVPTNLVYYGLIMFLVLWKLDWPKMPRNKNHRFWMRH